MQRKTARLLALLCVFAVLPGALADGAEVIVIGGGSDGAGEASAAAPTPAIRKETAELLAASAANAAALARAGEESPVYDYWETAQGHVPKQYRLKKACIAMLRNTVGIMDDADPVGRSPMTIRQCFEVPLPVDGEEMQEGLDYNLHGSIYSDSPLVSVTAAFVPDGDGEGETQAVTFDRAANVRGYSLVSDEEPLEGKALDTLIDISDQKPGTYRFSLSAATAAKKTPVTLYSATVRIVETKRYILTHNKFDENYTEAARFFGGDTAKFLFHYALKDTRSIATENAWRETYIVESELGRVHADAVPYFNKANEYLLSSYIRVSIRRPNGEIRIGKVMQLKKIMHKCSTYVPRFQSNMEYVSHHTLGTAADVNDNMYPNYNILTNHELIGGEVRDHLTYNGIETTEKGVQYYDFFYDGTYPAYYERVPKTIINYLLYELAFYRAGFQWGYYYETACDAMHFMLSEIDYNKHIDTDVGLRKVYEYTTNPVPEK